MHEESIQSLIESNLPNSSVSVTGDGRHFQALVIWASFEGMSLLARQKKVYEALGDEIKNGSIHALSIKAKTPAEWQFENQA